MDDLTQTLLDRRAETLLVVTGAGISRASGIRTFRGSEPDAVWKVSDVELATRAYFDRDPVGQWRWYIDRFQRVDGAQPNPAHRALAAIERWVVAQGGSLVTVTQNIDTLHEQAGTQRLIKIHGSSDRVRCSRYGCAHGAPRGSLARSELELDEFLADPSEETLPRCSDCGAPLRAHVLFFDEYYQDHDDYRFLEAVAIAESAQLVLFAGTSFSVGITDLVCRAAMTHQIPVFSIDPRPSPNTELYSIEPIQEAAEDYLPRLIAQLNPSGTVAR